MTEAFLYGFWDGLTSWIILIGHAVGAFESQPVFSLARGAWYDFGFLIGVGIWAAGSKTARRW